MYRTALATFGKTSSKSHDWFEAKSIKMTPVIEATRAAVAEYKLAPSERNLQILRIARIKAQQASRRCTNEYWTEHPVHRRNGKYQGSVRRHQEGTRTYLNKTAPLRSSSGEAITDKGHQLEEWMEHYSDL